MAHGFDPTQLTDRDLQLAASWKAAAADLGIQVVAPFDLPAGSSMFRYGALVVGFGTERGLLLRVDLISFDPASCGDICKEAIAAGYAVAYVSSLYCSYNRDEFIVFLNLFEWFGPPASRPSWHTGPAALNLRPGEVDEER